MKVTVTIIHTWCMHISEAVTVPSMMIMPSTVSEESLATGRHTDRHINRHCLVYVNFFKVLRLLKLKSDNTVEKYKFKTLKEGS